MLAFETCPLSVCRSWEEGLTPAIFSEARCKISPPPKNTLAGHHCQKEIPSQQDQLFHRAQRIHRLPAKHGCKYLQYQGPAERQFITEKSCQTYL